MPTQNEFQAARKATQAKYAAMRPFNVVKALVKTRASVYAHIERGAQGITSQRSQELVDRYNDLKESLLDRRGSDRWTAWQNYCDAHGSDFSHDGYDLFA